MLPFVLVSEITLKVNYVPYLVDIVLCKEVNAVRHKAIVKEGTLHITLFKKVAEHWGECVRKDEKDILDQIKAEALRKREEIEKEIDTKKGERKVDEERQAVRKQMSLDEAERGRLENLKQEEKKAAEQEIYETFAKMQAEEDKKKVATLLVNTNKPDTTLTTASSSNASENKPTKIAESKDSEIFEDYDMLSDMESGDEDEKVAPSKTDSQQAMSNNEEDSEPAEEDIKYIPPPRFSHIDPESGEVIENTDAAVAGKVKINFTPRLFPTPMRESKAAEEEDWIAKNRRHLKKHGVLGKQLGKGKGTDISEEDPTWLKAKGDDFFRAGDTKSALNAYSAAIDMDAQFLACYSNRAACYLKMNLFVQCKLDCDFAISKTMEELPQRTTDTAEQIKLLVSLVRLYLRRGSALCQLGQFQDSLNDYFQALTKYQLLDSSGLQQLSSISTKSIQADIDRLRILSNAETLKKEGDSLLGEKHLEKALEKYNAALQMIPVHVSALSNRSACKLALGKIESAIEDCQLAISLLQATENTSAVHEIMSNASMKIMLNAILPPPNSEKQKQWILKTLLRKAVALTQIDRLTEAIQDYEEASRIDPADETIKRDLMNLKKLVESSDEQKE
jgi:dyslexia susceptibility 1 candidate gene 1 protein